MAEFRRPTPGITDALKGTFSEPIKTTNPKGEPVTVRLSIEGSGQWGIPFVDENRGRAGINHHSLLTGRYSLHLADALLVARNRGLTEFSDHVAPNPQTILDAEIVSHAGRWAWENARDFPNDTDRLLGTAEGNRRRRITNEQLGLEFIQGRVPEDAFAVVAALGHDIEGFEVDPEVYAGWSYRLPSYVDHRTTDRWQPLDSRMAGFITANYFEPGTVTPETSAAVKETVRDIIDRQKAHRLEVPGARPITLAEADDMVGRIGAADTSARLSERSTVVNLILQDAITEADLERVDIHPDAINDTSVPMPAWEAALRRDYVAAAADEIIEKVNTADPEQVFPIDSWWGQTAIEVYRSNT